MHQSTLKTLATAAAAVLLAGCSVSEDYNFDPRAWQQNERDRAVEVAERTKRPLPTTLESPYLGPGAGQTGSAATAPTTGPALGSEPALRLPLHEIIQRAVVNNLDIKVAGYNPAIDETRVTEADARFDPTFFETVSIERHDKESAFFSNSNEHLITAQTGVRQLLESGGQAELSYQVNWNEPRKSPLITNQFWENDLKLEVTQPLLRDFGNDVNRARITINRNNQRVTLLDFRKQVEDTATEIEKDYWQLVQAERDVKINERLLDETVKTADVLRKRKGQDVTRVQLSQANASIEQRRATLIRAKAHVSDLSDQLKRQMNDPEMPVSSATQILPLDVPIEEPIRFDFKDQIDTALENRLELGQQQLRIDSAAVALTVARNNELPQLNVVGTMDIQGLDNEFKGAISDQAEWVNLNYTLGFQFELPIGNRAARAITQRALLQRQQAVDQYRNLVETISLDVKTALREVDTTWDEMVATRQARFAANDALRAIEQREQGGEALTPEFVQLKLDFQERFAQSASAENQAIANYNIALERLEQSKGTLLRYNNIAMEEDKLPIKK